MVYRFGASLYYANATRFTAEIMDIIENADPPVRWFAVAASAIGDIDYSGADSLRSVQEELAARDIIFGLLDVDPKVRTQLDRYGLTEKIGAARIFETIGDAADAYARATGDRRPADAVEPTGASPVKPDPPTPTETG